MLATNPFSGFRILPRTIGLPQDYSGRHIAAIYEELSLGFAQLDIDVCSRAMDASSINRTTSATFAKERMEDGDAAVCNGIDWNNVVRELGCFSDSR